MNDAFTPAQMEKLLAVAAAKLGTTPEGLRSAFEQGGLKGLSANLSPKQAETLQNGQAEQLLQDPAVQRLLIQLLGR
mgnify:CR=1 FL=1